jgi:hypothetical protein
VDGSARPWDVYLGPNDPDETQNWPIMQRKFVDDHAVVDVEDGSAETVEGLEESVLLGYKAQERALAVSYPL